MWTYYQRAQNTIYDFSGGEYVFLPFEKGVNNGGDLILFHINSYLVTCHWKGLLTREIMTLTKGFYEIPARNGGLPKLTSLLSNLEYKLSFRTGLVGVHTVCKLCFLKRGFARKELTITNFGVRLNYFIVRFFFISVIMFLVSIP